MAQGRGMSCLAFTVVYVYISRKYSNILHLSECMFVFSECKAIGLR